MDKWDPSRVSLEFSEYGVSYMGDRCEYYLDPSKQPKTIFIHSIKRSAQGVIIDRHGIYKFDDGRNVSMGLRQLRYEFSEFL